MGMARTPQQTRMRRRPGSRIGGSCEASDRSSRPSSPYGHTPRRPASAAEPGSLQPETEPQPHPHRHMQLPGPAPQRGRQHPRNQLFDRDGNLVGAWWRSARQADGSPGCQGASGRGLHSTSVGRMCSTRVEPPSATRPATGCSSHPERSVRYPDGLMWLTTGRLVWRFNDDGSNITPVADRHSLKRLHAVDVVLNSTPQFFCLGLPRSESASSYEVE